MLLYIIIISFCEGNRGSSFHSCWNRHWDSLLLFRSDETGSIRRKGNNLTGYKKDSDKNSFDLSTITSDLFLNSSELILYHLVDRKSFYYNELKL
jgi:hypothetical protein